VPALTSLCVCVHTCVRVCVCVSACDGGWALQSGGGERAGAVFPPGDGRIDDTEHVNAGPAPPARAPGHHNDSDDDDDDDDEEEEEEEEEEGLLPECPKCGASLRGLSAAAIESHLHTCFSLVAGRSPRGDRYLGTPRPHPDTYRTHGA
jgi:hypothetical protein